MVLLRYTPRHPAGFIYKGVDLGSDKVDEFSTVMCVHCHMHWSVQPGSGRQRGFCMQCLGPTCGKPQCIPCVPFEKLMEAVESGRQLDRALARLASQRGL